VVALGENPPGGAWVRLAADAEVLQSDALRIEHPEQVVVGLQQQLGRIAERLVESEPRRIGVPVRTDDRQSGDFRVELASQRSHAGICGKQSVGVQFELVCQRNSPRLVFCRTLAQW
jgi:hypothetical protein